MSLDDTYYTIDGRTVEVYKNKGSRFIALAFPITSKTEAKQILEAIRKEYYDAQHHCFAWAIGPSRESLRMNDDGEPSGTAGKQILSQIASCNLTNVLVIVVRYFGGTKLGVSGLIKAYTTSSRQALEKAIVKQIVIYEPYEIEFDYLNMKEVMRLLKEANIDPIKFENTNTCKISFSVRQGNAAQIIYQLSFIKTLIIKHLICA